MPQTKRAQPSSIGHHATITFSPRAPNVTLSHPHTNLAHSLTFGPRPKRGSNVTLTFPKTEPLTNPPLLTLLPCNVCQVPNVASPPPPQPSLILLPLRFTHVWPCSKHGVNMIPTYSMDKQTLKFGVGSVHCTHFFFFKLTWKTENHKRNHEETEEEEENREQRKLESSYKESKLIQGNIKVNMAKRDPRPHQRSKPKLTNLTTKSRLAHVANMAK
ncbi:hypothetical protein PIB30_076583 [Stylosanthes scabra]|uniref:Uncharacterized protein n=1 Tax=Stylosanthes scabra TaxID=79078 RepID=A0ABU6XQ86_9FABA|nr:hypothetical protein [Stylosanthes scabra]